MLQTFVTWKALKEKLGIQRALQENFKFTPMALEEYWALGHSEGTLGLGH